MIDEYDDLSQKALVSIKTLYYDSKKFNNLQDIPILKLNKENQILGIIASYLVTGSGRIINLSIMDTTYAVNLPEGEIENKILPVFINYSLPKETDSENLFITKENFNENDKLNLKILIYVSKQEYP